LLNSNTSSTCPRNIANFGPLTAEIGSKVWATPANFNCFRVLASLLQRRRSAEANQTFHDVWLSPGLLHYIHFRGLLPPNVILPDVKCTLRPSVAFSYIGNVTARHSSSGRQPYSAMLSRGRHLYLAGWPSRWASAHIRVYFFIEYARSSKTQDTRIWAMPNVMVALPNIGGALCTTPQSLADAHY